MNKKLLASILAVAVAAPIGIAVAKGEMKGHPNLILNFLSHWRSCRECLCHLLRQPRDLSKD